MSPMKETRQILVIDTSNSQSLNKKRQLYKAVLNKNIYKNSSKFSIDTLPKFLQANPLAKKKQFATK